LFKVVCQRYMTFSLHLMIIFPLFVTLKKSKGKPLLRVFAIVEKGSSSKKVSLVA
jgi:hypothetical protein